MGFQMIVEFKYKIGKTDWVKNPHYYRFTIDGRELSRINHVKCVCKDDMPGKYTYHDDYLCCDICSRVWLDRKHDY